MLPVKKVIALSTAFGVVALFAGCGSSGPRTIPVSGKVTLDGGPVPGAGFIYFTTLGSSGGAVSRPGTAEFAADGSYKAKTFADGDGLLPGKYLLRVECWKVAPNMEGKPTVSYIAPRYQDAMKSEHELVVTADKGAVTYDVALKSK